MDTMKKTDSGQKKVLVVEDDDKIRQIISRTLEMNGYMVMQASDGPQGLDKSKEADIVLLDMFLPGLSGHDLMGQVRGSGNYVPIVVMSAVLDREGAEKMCGKFGIVDFMEKPFKAADLVAKIGKAASVADDMRFMRKATDRLRGFIERQSKIAL